MPAPTYVIFLNGGYGVGKSSTLDHVGDLLAETGSAFSLMDVDWFHRSWPPAVNDPENVLTEAENMGAVWSNYRRAGPRQPVVAGVIASRQDQERYAEVFALPIRSVQLVAAATVVEARLRGRYTEHQLSGLRWHLEQVTDEMNTRPRRTLGWDSPDSIVRRYLDQDQEVGSGETVLQP